MVRKYLFARGLRYRKNVKQLPSTPDIVFPKYKTAVFVNGCFGYGHKGFKYSHLPSTTLEYWEKMSADTPENGTNKGQTAVACPFAGANIRNFPAESKKC